MKIEKISDNQIRCTLTREDLVSREIRLSELAYGSEKAKDLFRDMMQKAADDFGFDADNAPLMIEAIPLPSDTIILIITKVDDPDSLDHRISRFSPDDTGSRSGALPSLSDILSGADDILDLIRKFHAASRKSTAGDLSSEKDAGSGEMAAQEPAGQNVSDSSSASSDSSAADEGQAADEQFFGLTRFYIFHDLESVIRASRIVSQVYAGPNALFKNPEDNHYYLLLKKADTDATMFNKACNILSEYAMQVNYTPGMEEFFTEHMEVILSDGAVRKLAGI